MSKDSSLDRKPPTWRNWGDHPYVVTVIVAAAIVTIVGFLWDRGRSPNTPPSIESATIGRKQDSLGSESGAEKPAVVLLSPVTFQEVMGYVYDEVHTQIQRDEFLQHHLGRRVVWNGFVGNVSDDRAGDSLSVLITTEEGDSYKSAFLSFPREYRSDLVALDFGQKIEVACVFAEFSGRAHLRKCELLKVWPIEKKRS